MSSGKRIDKLEAASPTALGEPRFVTEAELEGLDYHKLMRLLRGQPDAEAAAMVLVEEDAGSDLEAAMAAAGVVRTVPLPGETKEQTAERLTGVELRVYGEWSEGRVQRVTLSAAPPAWPRPEPATTSCCGRCAVVFSSACRSRVGRFGRRSCRPSSRNWPRPSRFPPSPFSSTRG